VEALPGRNPFELKRYEYFDHTAALRAAIADSNGS
jgi:hypothetical protein